MLAACINADITWSDARLTLSVNTALFKQLTDTPTYSETVVVITHLTGKWSKGTVHHSPLLLLDFSSSSHVGEKCLKRLYSVKKQNKKTTSDTLRCFTFKI